MLLIFAGLAAPFVYIRISEFRENQAFLEKKRASFGKLAEDLHKEAADFEGEASVIVRDLDNGLEIAIKQDERLPSASLAKVPIMSACFYAAREQRVDLLEKLRLRAGDIVYGSGLLKHESPGKELTVEELLELMISESDNTATNMLIDRIGFAYLNGTFKTLGLEDTNVDRHMMDFRSRKKGIENFTSAKDIAKLLQEIYKQNLVDKEYSCKALELLKRQKSNDRIPAKLPEDVVIAHKTGLERTVCHDAGVVFTEKGDFVICVLTKHNGNGSGKAKEFISNVALLTYNCYQSF